MEYAVNLMFRDMTLQTPLGLASRPIVRFSSEVEKSSRLSSIIRNKLRKKSSWLFIDSADSKRGYHIKLFSLTDTEKAANFVVRLFSPEGKQIWQYSGRIKH